MSERREDFVMRFLDYCERLGPAGGLVFIFGGTAAIVGFSLALILAGSVIRAALS